MEEDEANDYGIFRRRHNPKQVFVRKPPKIENISDLQGPHELHSAETYKPRDGDCVLAYAEGYGSVVYGWVHGSGGRHVLVKHYPPALTALKEAIDAQDTS